MRAAHPRTHARPATPPQFCFDLSDGLLGSLVSSTNPNRCLCDFSRFTASRAAARRAWQSEVPYVLLGVGLAYLGLVRERKRFTHRCTQIYTNLGRG